MQLTLKQINHRAYLQSPLWQKKRQEALARYGCICARCQRHGTDVHHKTYARVGGGELMTDLEILCRGCHDAHHRVERITVKNRRTKAINSVALARYLTPNHRALLTSKFSMPWPLIYSAICDNAREDISEEALRLLGKKRTYVSQRHHYKGPRFTESMKKHHAKIFC